MLQFYSQDFEGLVGTNTLAYLPEASLTKTNGFYEGRFVDNQSMNWRKERNKPERKKRQRKKVGREAKGDRRDRTERRERRGRTR